MSRARRFVVPTSIAFACVACVACVTVVACGPDADPPRPSYGPPRDATVVDSTDDVVVTTDAPFEVHLEDAHLDVPFVKETEPPPIPIGLDAFRLWERWPYLRIGARTYMRSTYDRAGGNEAADASHFIRTTAPDHFVTLDVAGLGTLDFVRTNHWHGSPWHYVVDGRDTVVSESATADPTKPIENSIFLPKELFPAPLTVTWSTAKGADLDWVPIPFDSTFELAYGHTFYGTGYYIYTLYTPGAAMFSRPFRAWDGKMAPGADVLDLLSRAGEDLAPKGHDVVVHEGTIDVPASGSVVVADLSEGPSTIRALRLVIPRDHADALADAHLRITWDDRSAPSVDAPVSLFFGAGTFSNPNAREYLVKSLPASIHFEASTLTLSMYFPMPFFHRAKIELVSSGEAIAGVGFHLRTKKYDEPANWVGYFHATYHDIPSPVAGHDMVFLDTTKEEGGGDWCGNFVGTSFVFTDRLHGATLEGDPRFFFDDSQSPQAQGTGSEEWGGGGDYWDGMQQSTLPFAGHPVGARLDEKAPAPIDRIESEYRFLLSDLMPFGRNARIQFEHGGVDNESEHYRAIAYWYGAPGACLTQTDAFHVGDLEDEAKHHYVSAEASSVDTVTSRYELGVDHYGGTEIYPAETDTGRHTTGTSEFTLQIAPKNFGVLLRRKLDYSFVDQRADVFVADASSPTPKFERAGVWYLAGSNTSLYAFAGSESGTTGGSVQTSNRRWRDDEFLVPRALTEGRSAIRVRVVYRPVGLPVMPGKPVGAQAWSEVRYLSYVWTLPGG